MVHQGSYLAVIILLAGCATTNWRGVAVGATALDTASTVIALDRGATEQNPVLTSDKRRIVAIEATILAVLWYASKDLEPKQQETLWKWVTALHLGAFAWNVAQGEW